MDDNSNMPETKPKVEVRNIDLFNCRPSNLMIVPCSDTGTISAGFSRYLVQNGVNNLLFENRDSLYLGKVFSKASNHGLPGTLQAYTYSSFYKRELTFNVSTHV